MGKRALFIIGSEKALYPRAFFVEERLSKKRALFVIGSEKALYLRVFFVEERLSKKRVLFVSEKALYLRVFLEDYRKKELFLLVKKHCIFAPF